MIKAIDLSFDAPKVSPQWCQAQIAKGIQLLIVNLWAGGARVRGASQALRYWREAGGLTAAYFVVHDYRPAQEHFENAKANTGDEWEHLQFVAVDAEHIPEVHEVLGYTVTTPTIQEAVLLVEGAGKRAIIYTGYWYWVGYLGNSSDLSHVPLWSAHYDNDPDIDFVFNPYGGWAPKNVIGEQYTNTSNLDGIKVDFDVFSDSFVCGVTRAEHLANAINVLNGWNGEFVSISQRMQQATKELEDAEQTFRKYALGAE